MKKTTTLAELKRFSVKKKSDQQINDTRTSHLTDDMVAENQKVLEECRQHYDSLADFRDRRRRSRKYLRGDQWHELVEDENGEAITEENFIKANGKIPFKQNVIRQLMRSIIGQYRTNRSKTNVIARDRDDSKLSEMLTNTLQSAQYANATTELDARGAEEFFLSGMAISKTGYSWIKERNREDVFTEYINPNRVFFNADISDIRGIELRIIGEVKDAPLDDIISTFATNEQEEEKIKQWYTNVDPRNVVLMKDGLSADRLDSIDFYMPSDTGKARVIEVWQLANEWRTFAHDYLDGTYVVTKKTPQELQAVNDERLLLGIENGMDPEQIPLIDIKRKKEQFWTVKFLTPYGQCLYQAETIYKHESHPYTLTPYPLLDGEVWGLVEDIIDQQRSINRMVSLIDFMIGNAAKGVLMIHEDAIPDDMDIADYAEEWTKYNGVIKFKGKPGVPLPQQISANITNIGAHEMLSMQLKMVQDISGVSSAIQGKEAKSGTPSSLYAQEALNSTTNTRDMFDVFAWHKRQRDTKMLRVVQQFYDTPRYVAISGSNYSEEAKYYDPEKGASVDFDLVVAEGVDSPVYRQIIDDNLKGLLEMGVITGEMYLQNSSLPFADKILESIRAAKQQAQEGQMGQLPPEMMNQVQEGADPKAMGMLQQYMK